MKQFLTVIIGVSMLLFFFSCEKHEGEGGAAIIKGQLTAEEHNAVGELISSYPLAKEDVYIVYGAESSFYDDDVESSYDGSFEFRYLQPGNYTVFLYEKDVNDPSGDATLTFSVTITEKEEIVGLGEIIVEQ